MKCKEYKIALIKRSKAAERKNWTPLGQIVRKDEEIGDLSDDNTAKTPQERGKIERKQKDGELMQCRVFRGCLNINNQKCFEESLLLTVRDTGDGYEVYSANSLLRQFNKITTNKE